MADQPAAPQPAKSGKLAAWVKAGVITLAGMLSGGFVTYLTPLVDKLVKPAKPLANFAVEHQGLTVTFHNRSIGKGEGFWDFGDGSALEPVTAAQSSVTHTYPRPGSYTAKLSLRNIIGEESERTVSVQLEADAPEDPAVVTFEAVPVTPDAYAPATFRLTTKVKNVDWCVYDFGDELPMKVVNDPDTAPESMITFKEPGSHTIKLVAIKGKKTIEQNQVVWVSVPPRGTATALLTVIDQATQVERREIVETVCENFPPDAKEAVYRFDRRIQARPGFTVTEARLKTVQDNGSRNVALQLQPDRLAVRLTGELARATGLLSRRAPLPNLVVQVVLKQEKQSPATRAPVQLAATLEAPGAALLTLPPVPADWANVQRTIRLALQEDGRVVWQETQLPAGAPVVLQNRPYKLSATVAGEQVRVELAENKLQALKSADR
jgi:PKD repeat protein